MASAGAIAQVCRPQACHPQACRPQAFRLQACRPQAICRQVRLPQALLTWRLWRERAGAVACFGESLGVSNIIQNVGHNDSNTIVEYNNNNNLSLFIFLPTVRSSGRWLTLARGDC